MRRRWILSAALFGLAGAAAQDASAQKTVTLTVRVQEEGTNAALRGATVDVIGTVRGVTDDNGRVRFQRLVPGRHLLVVHAVGHASNEQSVMVAADQTIVVTLPVAVIALDPVTARALTFTLVGEVLGSDTRRAVPQAEITVGGTRATADAVGFFRVRRLPSQDTLAVVVSGMGYLPQHLTLSAGRDTTVRVFLDIDTVALAMTRAQLKRLDNITNAVPLPVKRITRDDVLRHAGSTRDRLKTYGVNVDNVVCLVIDNRVRPLPPRTRLPAGQRVGYSPVAQMIDALAPEEIERVEYVQRRNLLRIFTYRYVRAVLPGIEQLRAIPPVCV